MRRYRSGNDFILNDKEEMNDKMILQPHIDEVVSPYVVTSANGTAKVSLSGAIQLVNRFLIIYIHYLFWNISNKF